jgi:hypothetical protein
MPNEQIVWAVVFDSGDPSFAGEMTVATTFAPAGGGTANGRQKSRIRVWKWPVSRSPTLTLRRPDRYLSGSRPRQTGPHLDPIIHSRHNRTPDAPSGISRPIR